MAKRKLQRFNEMKTMACVFEPTMENVNDDNFFLKGKWRTDYFKNENPVILELGCGKGEYSVSLGRRYPEKNYVGVDIKGARIWYGAKSVLDEELKNVAFVRTRIDFVDHFFGKDEIDEIWLTFSDPQPNKPNKRLTSKYFIGLYKKFLKPGGIIHLKTDSDLLFESTLEQIELNQYEILVKSWDLYDDMHTFTPDGSAEILQIKTYYEELFAAKGFKIKYCCFRVN